MEPPLEKKTPSMGRRDDSLTSVPTSPPSSVQSSVPTSATLRMQIGVAVESSDTQGRRPEYIHHADDQAEYIHHEDDQAQHPPADAASTLGQQVPMQDNPVVEFLAHHQHRAPQRETSKPASAEDSPGLQSTISEPPPVHSHVPSRRPTVTFLVAVALLSGALIPLGALADRQLSSSNYSFHVYNCSYLAAALIVSALYLMITKCKGYYWASCAFPAVLNIAFFFFLQYMIQNDSRYEQNAYELVLGTRALLFEKGNMAKHWDDVGDPSSFYTWFRDEFCVGLFYSSAQDFPNNDQRYRYFLNKKQWAIAAVQVRQLKVSDSACELPQLFATSPTLSGMDIPCKQQYSSSGELTHTIVGSNGTSYPYVDGSYLNRGGSSVNGLSSAVTASRRGYGPGGYSHSTTFIPYVTTLESAQATVDQLERDNWLNETTSAVIVEVVLGSPSADVYVVLQAFLENTVSGSWVPSRVQSSVGNFPTYEHIASYSGWKEYYSGYVVLGNALIILLVRVSPGYPQFDVFDVMALLSAGVCLAIFAMMVCADYYWPTFNLMAFQSFSASGYFMSLNHKLVGVLLLLEMLQLLQPCRRFRALSMVQRTFFRAKLDIFIFAGLFIYILFFTSQTFFVVFSHDVESFSTIAKSVFALFTALVGLIDIDPVMQSDPIFGGVIFSFFIFFVLFTMLTIMIAIVSDAHAEAENSASAMNLCWDSRRYRSDPPGLIKGFIARFSRNLSCNLYAMRKQDEFLQASINDEEIDDLLISLDEWFVQREATPQVSFLKYHFDKALECMIRADNRAAGTDSTGALQGVVDDGIGTTAELSHFDQELEPSELENSTNVGRHCVAQLRQSTSAVLGPLPELHEFHTDAYDADEELVMPVRRASSVLGELQRNVRESVPVSHDPPPSARSRGQLTQRHRGHLRLLQEQTRHDVPSPRAPITSTRAPNLIN